MAKNEITKILRSKRSSRALGLNEHFELYTGRDREPVKLFPHECRDMGGIEERVCLAMSSSSSTKYGLLRNYTSLRKANEKRITIVSSRADEKIGNNNRLKSSGNGRRRNRFANSF